MNTLRGNAAVVAFTLCILGGWALTFLLNDWWWLCAGILSGLVAGDIADAIFRPPEPPPRNKIGKPR
jgi:hypothetical protein